MKKPENVMNKDTLPSIVKRDALASVVPLLVMAAEKRNTIPILSNILLETSGQQLRLTATNIEVTITADVAAECAEPFKTTVNAAAFAKAIAAISAGCEVGLAVHGADLVVTAGDFHGKFFVLPALDFLRDPSRDVLHSFVMDAAAFRTSIERVRFATSTEAVRYYLNGIYMHISVDGALCLVATDGHRLAVAKMECPTGAADIPGMIVPRDCMPALMSLLGRKGLVHVSVSHMRIRFTAGNVTLTSKLIDGTFPEYERVIPHSNDKALTVSTAPFCAAVEKAASFSGERSQPVSLYASQDTLFVAVKKEDVGEVRFKVNGGSVVYSAEAGKFSFQARYLKDIANQIEGDMRFEFLQPKDPAVITDTANPAVKFVLMPMNI